MPQKLVIATRQGSHGDDEERERRKPDGALPGAGARRSTSLAPASRSSRFAVLESSVPGNCADCYIYSIDYRGHAVDRQPRSTFPGG